ncbi:MAG: hypothetical protein V4773_08165 [Verrucomicrobiota bacterium]
MKWFTVPALLAAALFSAIVALPFLPAARSIPDLFTLEARIASSVGGEFQIFYDDGKGVREELSVRAGLTASATPLVYRFPLAEGTYSGFRIDPLDRPGTVTIASVRVLASSGREIATFPLERLQQVQQIASSRLTGTGLELAIATQANDPQLLYSPAPPLVVTASWLDYKRRSLPIVFSIFGGLAALLFTIDRAPRLRARALTLARGLAARPARAIATISLVAVVVSAYPVVFLGKSHVSPNMGTILLYDNFPTLPGYTSAERVDAKMADVGAIMWQHVPFAMMQRRALGQGELPLWNRYNALGVPLLAQGQSMFGDPLHLLVVAANSASWAWDLKYLLAKWLFALGLGLTVLALTRSSSPSLGSAFSPSLMPALLVSASAPFIGFFLYRINHPAFFSLCYAPWPLYCLVRLAQAPTRRASAFALAGLIVANLALMNSGTVKEAYMLLLCVNFSGACILLASPAPLRERLLKLAALAWAGGLFALLTAPIWASFLQTLKNAYTGYNTVSAYQIQPSLLLGLFDEIFYRPLMSEDRVFSPSLNFLLLLGVLYFVATLRLQFARRTAMALAASSLLPLSLAFGLISPTWIGTLPFLGNIAHLDNTFSCVLIVLWSVVAGLGFATAASRLGTREGRHDLIVAGLLLGALVFGWIAFRQAAHRPIYGPIFTVHQPGQVLHVAPFIWDYLAALLLAAAALGWLVQRAFARGRFGSGSVVLIALCLIALLWRHGFHADSVGYPSFTGHLTTRVDLQARSTAIEFTRAAHAREPGRGYGFTGNFFPGWTGVYGLETIHGPDALVNPFVRELIGVSGVERIWDWRLYLEASQVATARPFFDALNVRFYFDMLSKHPALAQELRLVHGSDIDVYESPTAWPRAFFTDRLDIYEKPEELVAKFRAADRPLAAFQASDLPAHPRLAALPRDAHARTVAPATDYRLTENSTSFRVRTSGPGVVVLAEAYWPGDMRATLDGIPAPVVRLNHAFRGIVVDSPGDHAVAFRYQPRNFPRNLLLCGVGAVLLVASFVIFIRSPRAHPPHTMTAAPT